MYRFDELWRDGTAAGFVIECSSGTYVRSLIADLGDAYCEALRRTRIGDFDVADADPRADRRRSSAPWASCPRCDWTPTRAAGSRTDSAWRFRAGAGAAGTLRLTDADGLVALGEVTEAGALAPIVGLRAATSGAH